MQYKRIVRRTQVQLMRNREARAEGMVVCCKAVLCGSEERKEEERDGGMKRMGRVLD